MPWLPRLTKIVPLPRRKLRVLPCPSAPHLPSSLIYLLHRLPERSEEARKRSQNGESQNVGGLVLLDSISCISCLPPLSLIKLGDLIKEHTATITELEKKSDKKSPEQEEFEIKKRRM